MQARDDTAVIQTLRDYYAASNKHDLTSMVSYYHEPVMFITARGAASFARHADVAPTLTHSSSDSRHWVLLAVIGPTFT